MPNTALRVAILGIAAVVMVPGAAAAKPSPAQKCAAAKQQIAAKSSVCQLKCTAKAALKGLPASDADLAGCLDKCRTKFADAFAKAEAKAKGGCDPTGNSSAVAAKVDACAGDLADDLQPGGRNPRCTVPLRADARDILDGILFALDPGGTQRSRVVRRESGPLLSGRRSRIALRAPPARLRTARRGGGNDPDGRRGRSRSRRRRDPAPLDDRDRPSHRRPDRRCLRDSHRHRARALAASRASLFQCTSAPIACAWDRLEPSRSTA